MGSFEREPTPLQKTELEVDIELRDILEELELEENITLELAENAARRAYLRGVDWVIKQYIDTLGDPRDKNGQ